MGLSSFENEDTIEEKDDFLSLENELEYQKPNFGEEDDDNPKEKGIVNNIIKANISNYPNGIQIESIISSLVGGYYIVPKFQRRFVWNKRQVAMLALSIIKDVPIPPLYLYRNENKKQVILDGQQRVTAMFLYFNNLWYTGSENYQRFDFAEIQRLNDQLCSLEKQHAEAKKSKNSVTNINKQIREVKKILKEKHGVRRDKFYIMYNGKKKDISFSSFSENEQDFLLRKRMEITIVECRSANPQKVYADIFKLLNTAGKILGTQEIRNGIYWELPLYEKLFDLNNNATWRDIYGKPSPYSRDVEILLKMLALNSNSELGTISRDGILTEGIIVKFPGTFSWSNIMEDYSDDSRNWSDDKVEREIQKLTSYINNIEGADRSEKKCNKAVFEAVFVAMDILNIHSKIDYEWLCSLEKEKEFFKGNVLSNKTSVQERLSKALLMVKEKFNV